MKRQDFLFNLGFNGPLTSTPTHTRAPLTVFELSECFNGPLTSTPTHTCSARGNAAQQTRCRVSMGHSLRRPLTQAAVRPPAEARVVSMGHSLRRPLTRSSWPVMFPASTVSMGHSLRRPLTQATRLFTRSMCSMFQWATHFDAHSHP